VLADLMNLLFEPGYPRGYVGRHRAPGLAGPLRLPAGQVRIRAIVPVRAR
jgi:hypothetical protein